MIATKSLFVAILILLPALSAAQPVDLRHHSSQPDSELETERYGKIEIYVRGTGYVVHYGQLSEQDFDHPEFADGEFVKPITDFFAAQLGFASSEFVDEVAHIMADGQEYYLKLDTFATSYSYELLKVTPCPEVVSLPVENEYLQMERVQKFPRHELIPHVEGFTISDVDYANFDEVTFYYDGSGHTHEGQFWHIDFDKIADDNDSYRYIVAHDYKEKMLAMGGRILKDEDNNFVFELGGSVAKLGCYNSAFSLKIIQEEIFQQSLVLSPDKIKTELDRTGKVILEGIFFEFDKATLKPESRRAILSTVALLENYSDLVLAINGHTDAQGSEDYNQTLSSERAASVVTALVAEGIDASRLQSRGFGESEPIASNETEEGRATNRRVELHKISGGEEKALITIDFIKPLENSVVDSRYSHANSELGVQYTLLYSDEEDYLEYSGQLEVISYEIIKDGAIDESVSRKEIIRNYENVLDLYGAELLGEYSNTLYFKIPDRGDGKQVFGRVEGYTGSYTIRFLIQD